MTGTLRALLVGIDDYEGAVRPLRGCVADILAVEQFLLARVAGAGAGTGTGTATGMAVDIHVLTNGDATRAAIRAGFAQHLGATGPGDVALFWFCGHGSQQRTASELLHLEPDGMDETLVCVNSRTTDWDLSDKELAVLIRGVEAGGGHVLVVLDSCHSGTATRTLADAGDVSVRHIPADPRERPLASYDLGTSDGATLPVTAGPGTRGIVPSGWSLPGSNHVLLAGCRADQLSKERPVEGAIRGVFSHALLTTLAVASGPLSYREVHARATARVVATVAEQTPQLETADPALLQAPFLGGAALSPTPFFTMRHDPSAGWVIDGGAAHGITPPSAGETTMLAYHATAAEIPAGTPLGRASVTAVRPAESSVSPTGPDGVPPDPSTTYPAVVVATPLPPMGFILTGDEDGIAAVRAGLSSALVAEVTDATATFRVAARDGAYRIAHVGDARALVVDVPGGYSPASVRGLIDRLEHLTRWTTTLELTNPTSRLAADAVTIAVFRSRPAGGGVDPDATGADLAGGGNEILLAYEGPEGWSPPRVWIRVRNTSNRTLHCALLALTGSYGISAVLMRSERLGPGEEAWALRGDPVQATVPDRPWDQGVIEYRDTLKVVASTEAFDASHLELPDLDDAGPRDVLRGEAPASALDRLLARVGTRDLGPVGAPGPSPDWTTTELVVTTVRPLRGRAVRSTDAAELDGLTIQPHPRLVATARLSSLPATTRSLDALTLPHLLRDDPGVVRPLELTEGRDGGPGLSVLELSGVADPSVVTPAEPLVLETDVPLADGERVLALGFDGEFFLPLGHGTPTDGVTRIQIDHLPPEAADAGRPGLRSLGGTIRIFLHKILSRVPVLNEIVRAFPYPILAVTEIADGEVRYDATVATVRGRVAQADRVLLLVHGILGDTRGMALDAHRLIAAGALPHQVVLTLDYENIDTPLEETAESLRRRLEEVGLGPGHGTDLDIVAHSMGGLVSRWLIERTPNAPEVRRLVMLGTPNGGSPWPTVQQWATVAIGLGLNAMTAVAWPIRALGWLLQGLERVDDALDQMQPGSPLLLTLAGSPDPGVPYAALGGDRSLAAGVLDGGRLARLLNALKEEALDRLFREPNDIAVGVSSVHSLPMGREPAIETRLVPCDHFTYLSAASAAVVDALL